MEGPVEIRRKESIKPPSLSAQEINGSLLSNGALANAVSDGLSPYRDAVVSPTMEEEEEETTQWAVTCRVCNNEIIIEKEEGFVVKCGVCNEATPIRNAPVGEKYVRCPCHCLLICKDSSERIACPRQNCKRIITITAAVDGTGPLSQSFAASNNTTPGTCHVVCVHCGQDFLFNILHKSLAKCPHCNKISAVGNVYRRRQLRVYSVVAFLFLLVTVLVIVGTYFLVAESGGIVALYVGLVAITVLAAVRVVYFFRMKVSQVQGTF
ncbi:type I phosphatidylinositol 4,5-bisphosphate 4-phosphatase-B-like isoform X2 [Paramacrobiotus metropolitanus]|uniref:type I phosphatidylinositol 4,5-bisphosphate 4-phosphatase-B-like isoform X2 n=1 Tax=Paramacrobiotus metropolitanus TaxID=2943436 RepID=UPI0024456C77|nr:type I phosphatidylinositol 4,5-bisphosphate 4-phosphatase-B-like isoform X2 [Paramacrobiotus metropolitanus]